MNARFWADWDAEQYGTERTHWSQTFGPPQARNCQGRSKPRCRPLTQPALSAYQAGELEQLPKVLAEQQRLRILKKLVQARGEPLTVGEFVQALRLRQPSVSYHLKLLREVGLLERETRGSSAFYRINPAAFERIAALLALQPALAGGEPAGASASEAL